MRRLLLIVFGFMVVTSALSSAQAPPRAAASDKPARLAAARIAPRPEPGWTAEEKALVAEFSREAGQPTDFQTLLNHPEAVKGVMPFYNYVAYDSGLPPEDRQILIMRTAWLTQNEYLWGHHNWLANKLGLTGPEIRGIAEGFQARGSDPFYKTLTQAADELHQNSFISTPTWNALAERYSQADLIDAVFTVAQMTAIAGALNSMGVQQEVIASGVQLAKLPGVPFKITAPVREAPLATARIKALEPSEWTPAVRTMLDPRNTGTAIALYRTFAQNPKVYPSRNTQSEHIRMHSTLSAKARELLILRTAWLAKCEYVWAQHVRQGKTAGLETAKIPIGAEAPGWEPIDALLIRAADELYNDDMISDATWKGLSAQLNPKQMIDVLVTAGGYRATAMAGNSFGVQLEANAERFPSAGSK